MKTRLKNDIIDVLEYFEYGLADIQEGSGEEQPKLKEIRSILRRLKANGDSSKNSNCNIPHVSGSALLTELLNKQQEIISNPRRFNGISVDDIKQLFAKYGIDYKEPF